MHPIKRFPVWLECVIVGGLLLAVAALLIPVVS